jgi:hypothetical protein
MDERLAALQAERERAERPRPDDPSTP